MVKNPLLEIQENIFMCFLEDELKKPWLVSNSSSIKPSLNRIFNSKSELKGGSIKKLCLSRKYETQERIKSSIFSAD